ncbi:MAG: nitrite reductase small subunit NirD [Nocardioides sp.]|nr:nitrite reductase small subunit NirD [Nocardioides sp.]
MATRRSVRGSSPPDEWQPVCRLGELEVDRGATALVHGQALAIFRTDRSVFALGNHDPFSRTSSIARGIVGRRGEVPFVGSPAHGHRFDLRTGQCLDDLHSAVPSYDVKVVDGVVLVGRRKGQHVRPA